MMAAATSELVNGGRRLRNERPGGYLFKKGQENDDKGPLAHESDQKFEYGIGTYLKSGSPFQPVLHGIPAAGDASFSGCHFLDAVASDNLLITVNSGCSLPKECETVTTRRVVTKISRNILEDLHRLPPFSGEGKGVILEPLSYLADSEGSGNTGNIKTSKVTLYEVSSVEKYPVNMNFSKETNPLLGGHSVSSDKALHMEVNSDSSSSKAPCLEVEIPMECSDQTKQKSNLCMDNSPEAEPSYRWVKRLKLSSSHSSAQGTKSINLAENSGTKRNNFSGRILKSETKRSESTLRVHHGEESMALGRSINLSKVNLGNDPSLSHVWIQRWLHDGSKSTRKKPYTMLDCEPQSLKWASKDLQKDRSPSIRAMALMGKAIKSFRPYQLKKRGSLTLWNTKDV